MKPSPLPALTPLWTIVRLQWTAARRRAAARKRRQRELMGRKSALAESGSTLAMVLMPLVFILMHVLFAWIPLQERNLLVLSSFEVGTPVLLESEAWSNVTALDRAENTLQELRSLNWKAAQAPEVYRHGLSDALKRRDECLNRFLSSVGENYLSGQEREAYRKQVEKRWREEGIKGFSLSPELGMEGHLRHSLREADPLIPLTGITLLTWLLVMLCQGEGLELDINRRRYPVWEWLLSHPVNPAHVFYVELLLPLMANPLYLTAPVFVWVLVGSVQGILGGLLVALLGGLPLAIACSAVHKAIETFALLRMDVRKRGALLGILSWLGFVLYLLPVVVFQLRNSSHFVQHAGYDLQNWVPAWPIRSLLYGWGAEPSLWQLVLSWWILSGALLGTSVWLCSRYTLRGFHASGELTAAKTQSKRRWLQGTGAQMLWRKEGLWLMRDRGAVVQIILIPLSLAGAQVLNFGHIFSSATLSWNLLCGIAVLCGTYFLMVLGPRSLISEGPALWLSLTWPQGLEELLRQKARLWALVANLIVSSLLVVALVLFPGDWWRILAVAAAWFVFSSSLALKSVALVTPADSNGEAGKPNRLASWLAMLGTLGFAAGILSGTWQAAAMGIVFSSLVAVAMWERLRARLPYLFDTWAEAPRPSPSLVEVCVGITLIMEFMGAAMVIAHLASGANAVWAARAWAYAFSSLVGVFFLQLHLSGKGVSLASLWTWASTKTSGKALGEGLGLGLAGGVLLALGALGYQVLLHSIPALQSLLERDLAGLPTGGQATALGVMAVIFAPFCEEYLFRGLLFRTLYRDLGDWRAYVLSAACFMVLHPPMAWLPVFLVGLLNAWLFKRSGSLWPCVLLHACYNAIVVGVGTF